MIPGALFVHCVPFHLAGTLPHALYASPGSKYWLR